MPDEKGTVPFSRRRPESATQRSPRRENRDSPQRSMQSIAANARNTTEVSSMKLWPTTIATGDKGEDVAGSDWRSSVAPADQKKQHRHGRHAQRDRDRPAPNVQLLAERLPQPGGQTKRTPATPSGGDSGSRRGGSRASGTRGSPCLRPSSGRSSRRRHSWRRSCPAAAGRWPPGERQPSG